MHHKNQRTFTDFLLQANNKEAEEMKLKFRKNEFKEAWLKEEVR